IFSELACGNAMSNSTGSQSTGCSSTMYCCQGNNVNSGTAMLCSTATPSSSS
ncbi:unnamed protein product, partial [Adineta steineri]